MESKTMIAPSQQNNLDVIVSELAPANGHDGAHGDGPAAAIALLDDRLRGRWIRMIGLGMVLGVVLGVAGYQTAPVRYESSGKISVAPKGSAILRETEDNTVVTGYSGLLKTLAVLVKEPRVVEEALRDPKLAALPLAQGPTALEAITGGIEPSPIAGTQLISVTFRAESPEAAQTVVNAVLGAYERLYGEKRSETRGQRLDFLQEQERQLRRQRGFKQEEIEQLIKQSKHGTRNLEQILQMKLVHLEELEQEAERLELALQGAADMPDDARDDVIDREPTLDELVRVDLELARLVSERDRLAAKFEEIREDFVDPTRNFTWNSIERAIEALERQISDRLPKARETWKTVRSLVPGSGAISTRQMRKQLESLQVLIAQNKQEIRDLGNQQLALNQLERELSDTDSLLQEVQDTIETFRIESNPEFFSGRIKIEHWGSRPRRPAKDRRRQMAFAGFVAGLAMSLGIFLLVGSIDRRAYHTSQLRRNGTHAQCLGALPDLRAEPLNFDLAQTASACVHQIRNRIEVLRDPASSFMFAITSPYQGDGKTSLTMALSWSYAAARFRTLLVDCDLTGQGLTRQLGLLAHVGLREVLREKRLDGHVVALETPNLSVLPAGVDSSFGPEAIRKDDFEAMCHELRQQFDVILVDTGPYQEAVEILPISTTADGVVLTVRRGKPRSRLEDCIRDLQSTQARCLGVVLNCAVQADCRHYGSLGRTRRALRATGDECEGMSANKQRASTEQADPLLRAMEQAVDPKE